MGYKLNKTLLLSDLAAELGLPLYGLDISLDGVAPANLVSTGELTFSTSEPPRIDQIAVITDRDPSSGDPQCGYLLSENPRLDFIRALNFLAECVGFSRDRDESEIHPSVRVGKNVVIEDGCVVGEGTVIAHNVVLHSGTRIGKFCKINSGAIIGGDGFGFERMADGTPLKFPHLGGVLIGDKVEIGALNSVARGTLSDTIISDFVKTDNLVHIAHNCKIGPSSLITACAELSGGVVLGKEVWIGPNASIMQKVSIGDGALVGLGAVVTKSIPEFTVFAGNPAKKIRDIK